MHASESQFKVLIGGEKQFVIPLFQRPYSWNRANWETLWNDLLETYAIESNNRHFLGSIVTKALNASPTGVASFLVIDGQQRITTIAIILAALRDAVRQSGPQLAQKIHELYLTNEFASGLAKYKILPTQVDRDAYFDVVGDSETYDANSRIGRAYDYFRKSLSEGDPDDTPIDLARLEQVIMSGLELVSIELAESDNEYRIFESLNAKGADLTQADLLRNYFFMRISPNEQEAIYADVWLPMQSDLGTSLEDFFRYEYMADGQFVREADVYQEWKRRLDGLKSAEELVEQLRLLAEHSRFYRRLIDPIAEPDERIARGLRRLNRWGGQTMYPYLLYLYRHYDSGGLSAEGFAEILLMIESFLVRRLFARVPTNSLSRLFYRISQQLPTEVGLVEGTRMVLSEPTRRWPREDEFRVGILGHALYTDSRPDQRRLILETLEESYGHKEAVDVSSLTIEHIMPQGLTVAWAEALGDEAKGVHAKLLHVLGNLTLTGYNPELSNKPFAEKRTALAASHLEMNAEIAQVTVWTGSEIEARGRRLAERAMRIWPGPSVDAAASDDRR